MRTFVQEPEIQQGNKPEKAVTPGITRAACMLGADSVRQLQRTIGNRTVRRLIEEDTQPTTVESDLPAYDLTRIRMQRIGAIRYKRAALTRRAPPVRVDRVRDEQQDQEITGPGESGGAGGARQTEIEAAAQQTETASAAQGAETVAVAESVGGGRNS